MGMFAYVPKFRYTYKMSNPSTHPAGRADHASPHPAQDAGGSIPGSANSSPPDAKKTVRIGDKLMSLGLISKDQLQIALLEQKNSKKLLGTILVEMGFVTESALGEVLA